MSVKYYFIHSGKNVMNSMVVTASQSSGTAYVFCDILE
jgi:hypothetical protein